MLRSRAFLNTYASRRGNPPQSGMKGMPPTPPICRDCKYFEMDKFYRLGEPLSILDYELGRCKYIAHIHIISGEKTYPFATVMRVNGLNQCGYEGKFFEPKEEAQKEEEEADDETDDDSVNGCY